MSNKIVPAIYRAVIDDVILNIKSDFDEYGVSEDVLADLQKKWEAKVVASHVAEFEAPPAPPPQTHQYPPHPTHPHTPLHYQPPATSHPSLPHYPPAHNPYMGLPPPPPPHIKSEPMNYQIPAMRPPPMYPPPQGPRPVARPYIPVNPSTTTTAQSSASSTTPTPAPPAPTARIPQVDGPSSSGSSSVSPPPQLQYAPHSSHPSLPSRPSIQTNGIGDKDDEAINSDLDDSDTDESEDVDEGGPGDSDIVFCTYDKVARVKNKWKCVLKDGMVHVNGKDYLFSKCTGEFEW